jgi:hypothetical protein
MNTTTTKEKHMQQHTNASVLTTHGIDLGAIEHPELEIPIVTGNQRQGDVLILKVTTAHAGKPIGKGITVVRAETNTSNTHTLVGDGHWEPNARANREDELVQGWLTVPNGGEAFLIHTEEHSALGIGEGTYEIRRQREFAGEWRRVAD